MPAAQQTSAGETMSSFVRFLTTEFPQLNRACRDGELSLSAWIDAITPIVRETKLIANQLDAEGTDLAIRGAGMVVLASERLAQPLGYKPGAVLPRLSGLADMLVALVGSGGRPALTHKGYWIKNLRPLQITFTDSTYEKFFIGAVQSQTAIRQSAHNLLGPICTGQVDPTTSIAPRMVYGAAAVLEQGQRQYRDFHRGPDGQPGQTPAEFNEMRAWLPNTRIGGKVYGGPNAAYIVDMVGTDFVLGTADDHYKDYVQGFLEELDVDERRLLQQYADTPSVIEVISAAAGYGSTHLMATAPTDAVAARLASSANLFATATAAKDLYRAFSGGSGAHVGLIATHLIKHSQSMTPKERAGLAVDPDTGVGGHGHDHTRQLHDRRRTNPTWKKLVEAVGLVNASSGVGHKGAAA